MLSSPAMFDGDSGYLPWSSIVTSTSLVRKRTVPLQERMRSII